ncbi:MAG: IS110 family transposase [Chloroflexi bacterium]|nr:IS110 family transposase [Chloroflexota bacterium]
MNCNYLGIDIAKAKFDVALLRGERSWHHQFTNKPKGFEELQAWLSKLGVTDLHACMEATSTYGLALATFLYEQDYTVSVVNPFQVKHFAHSELRRTKTDRVDAAVIARFCRALRPEPWQPLPPELSALQAFVRRLEALQAMHTQENNRLQVPGMIEPVQASIRVILEALEVEIVTIQRQIEDHLGQYPQLKEQRDLLTSIPGIGETTANVILSEIGDVKMYESARQVAAHAGLTPAQRQSGSSVHGKASLSKRGDARLRKALYWPAIVALRANPILRRFAERQREMGKAKMVIIAAAMRKLLHLAFGILKNNKPFDPNYQPFRA